MIGLLVKKTVVNTQRELENRKREQELKEARQKKKMKEEMMKKDRIPERAARNASETEPDMAEALNMDEFRD